MLGVGSMSIKCRLDPIYIIADAFIVDVAVVFVLLLAFLNTLIAHAKLSRLSRQFSSFDGDPTLSRNVNQFPSVESSVTLRYKSDRTGPPLDP